MSAKRDFVEDNPYLVYTSKNNVAYSGGDSPTPPVPPVGSKGIIYIVNASGGQYTLDGIYELPVNAESLADGTLVNTSDMKSVADEYLDMLEFKYDPGKIIFIKTSATPLSNTFTNICQFANSYKSSLNDASGEDIEKGCWFIMPNIEFTPLDMDDPDINIQDVVNNACSNTNPVPIIIFNADD